MTRTNRTVPPPTPTPPTPTPSTTARPGGPTRSTTAAAASDRPARGVAAAQGATSGTRKRRRVALIIETSNEYARGLLHGIRTYIREHESWDIDLDEHRR